MNQIVFLSVILAGVATFAASVEVVLHELVSSEQPQLQEDTLRLVHVLHRHGDSTPDDFIIYSTNQFTDEKWYWPYGFGQLTDEGKIREYLVGTELRKRYDSFLGDVYNINYVDAWSTDYNRTKASLELSLAGLWPPSEIQTWNKYLNWQPIPYNYKRTSEDKEMYWFLACKGYQTAYGKVLQNKTIVSYLNDRYNESVYQVMNANNITTSLTNAVFLWFTLKKQQKLGLPLDEWTKQLYPEPLHSLTMDFYHLESNTTALRKISSGYLLKKILADSAGKINGTLTPAARKIFMYSGHEQNVGAFLLGLDAFKLVDIPAPGSHVMVELHEIEGVWGFKLFYQDWTTENGEPYALTIPGCKHFCPYDEFVSLVSDILPESDEECYGSS